MIWQWSRQCNPQPQAADEEKQKVGLDQNVKLLFFKELDQGHEIEPTERYLQYS